MKCKKFSLGLLGVAAAGLVCTSASAFVTETEREFVGDGDFDGDGRQDLVIVDKASGKFRLGYQLTNSVYTWVDFRPTGAKDVTGVAVGRLFDPKRDALAITSADAGQTLVADASDPAAAAAPIPLPISVLGPNTVLTVDIGGPGNTPLEDIYLGSIYNNDPATQTTLFRDDAGKFTKLADLPLKAPLVRANKIALRVGAPELAVMIEAGDDGGTLRVESLASGKPQAVLTVPDLASGSDYTIGSFRGSPLREFVFYKRGANAVQVRPVEEPSTGNFRVGAAASFDLGQPVGNVFTLVEPKNNKLLVIFDKGERAGLFKFDGAKAPESLRLLSAAEGEVFTAAAPVATGFFLFSSFTNTKFSAGFDYSDRYQFYTLSGETNANTPFGKLPSLADTDFTTVPEIHKRIVEGLKIKHESEMQPYTNMIPGTDVKYVMVPIKGGEFVMGSPEGEAGRKPDEGPLHKVKVSPFWMGKFEVSWDEYELFMYPDDEKKLREQFPTEAYVDQLSDAVTRPSKPYADMTFGMGKRNFPAISMTQHGANKYCQWLSAKTGHYYRLPTEAEWEYAARAGTKTTFFFGEDESKLPEYAWFEQNSDFKYSKIGRKKPNPWGLHDILGNVAEWCLDQYEPKAYEQCAPAGAVDPWIKSTKTYPHVVRGGSYDDEVGWLRCAVRRASDKSWKMRDPQLPKSVWYFTDAQFVGFRLVRPLAVPPPEEVQKCWISGVEKD